jgi:general secretion pathway protein D
LSHQPKELLNEMNNFKYINSILISVLLLSACTSPQRVTLPVQKSYLTGKNISTEVAGAELVSNTNANDTEQQQTFRFVPPMKLNTSEAKSAEDVLTQFSDIKTISITTEELPLKDYLHQVLGEQLKVSYVLGDEVKNDNQAVTLNLQDSITERKLFTLTEELLTQRKYVIRFDDNIFYVHKMDANGGSGNIVFGYGKNVSDVPQTSLDIVQMVTFDYGMQVSLALTLRNLLGVKAAPDLIRNTLTIQGKRKDVIRALELIQIMDQPTVRDRHIGVYKSTFLSTQELITTLTELLSQEGITVGNNTSLALSIIELDQQGELILFANNLDVIDRAVFWLTQIDKPITSAEEQYFIYQPTYSRAIDMGESLEALISGSSTGVTNSTSAAGQNSRGSAVISASSKDMKMVVDERSNSLIFFTSGESYQQLYPLIKRLDVLPKQVMLEVMIAEVTLTDTFKSGVEFLLTNQGNATNIGGFSIGSGATGLSYILTGARGNFTLDLLQRNENVNVLSRPSLLVRDGVTASISVGNDIPTVGEIITDPVNGSQTSVVYRKTGIELQVKPTVNARGVVIMEVDQQISNQTAGGDSVAGSPIVFERSVKTEAIAESGQTIILGGLISESTSISDTKVPFFSSIPLLGMLFDTKDDATDKTELVVMITPRIIESSEQWEDIKAKFTASFNELELP